MRRRILSLKTQIQTRSQPLILRMKTGGCSFMLTCRCAGGQLFTAFYYTLTLEIFQRYCSWQLCVCVDLLRSQDLHQRASVPGSGLKLLFEGQKHEFTVLKTQETLQDLKMLLLSWLLDKDSFTGAFLKFCLSTRPQTDWDWVQREGDPVQRAGLWHLDRSEATGAAAAVDSYSRWF